MKKRVLIGVLFVLVLLLVTIASAKIVILNNFKDMYNIGDTVAVEGYLIAEKTADELFSLELQCPSYSKVNSINVKLTKDKK